MLKTFTITTEIQSNREVRITLPADMPLGQAEIVLVISSAAAHAPHTLGDMLHSEFFGMWQDRDDIDDSADFARQLRAKAWSRVL